MFHPVLEAKNSTDKWIPVMLVDATDGYTPETGIVFGGVTAKYCKEGDTSLTTYTPTTDEWKESGEGKYWLLIGASEFTSNATYEVSVVASGCRTSYCELEVRAQTLTELLGTSNTATLNLKKLNIVNNAGDAIVAQSTSPAGRGILAQGYGNNGHGIYALGTNVCGAGVGIKCEGVGGTAQGLLVISASAAGIETSGTSHGILAYSSSTGHGINAIGGTSSGNGIEASANNGHGINVVGAGINKIGLKVTGGTDGDGVQIQSTGTGKGLAITAASNHGMVITGGLYGAQINGTDGDGLSIAGGTDGCGLRTVGAGIGAGLRAEANGTGHGFHARAKTSSGGTGDGIRSEGGGTSGDGFHANATTAGDGIEAVGAGVGYDINADLHGGIDGTIDALTVSTHAEPAAGAPPDSPTIKEMALYVYENVVKTKVNFNKDTGVENVYKNNGTDVRNKRTVTDDGTTTTKGVAVAA